LKPALFSIVDVLIFVAPYILATELAATRAWAATKAV